MCSSAIGSAHISQRSPRRGAGRVGGCAAAPQRRRRRRAGAATLGTAARPRRQRDRQHAVAHQQRQRIEVRVRIVEPGAGAADVEVGAALRAAQHRVAGRPPSRRSSRAPARLPSNRAAVAVGVQVAADPARPAPRTPPTANPPTSPAPARRAGHRVPGAPPGPPWPSSSRIARTQRRHRDHRRAGRRPVGATSTSIAVTSGAAASMAPSTASCRVTDDDGQPSQLPSSRSRTTPSSLDVRAVRRRRRASRGRAGRCPARRPPGRPRRPGAARAPAAAWRPVRRRPARPAPPRRAGRLVDDLQHPLQPGAVEVGHQPDQLLGALAAPSARRAELASSSASIRSPVCARSRRPSGPRPLRRSGVRHDRRHSPVTDWVGECSISSFLPPPRYMCTPHGRHGSKLRTVRMMSMPLK